MNLDRDQIKRSIRARVAELARNLDNDASRLTDDDVIPTTGLLDSAAILELIVWYESEFDITLASDEINMDNLGSVNAMADFLIGRKSAHPTAG